MIIKTKRYAINFEKLPTLVFLGLLSLLLSLGAWQLNRAQQKRDFLQQQAQSQTIETARLSTAIGNNVETLRYRKLEAVGHYDVEHQFLIDNQISEGKVGYFVLTPFILQGENKAVLVNRGWIALNSDRSHLPDVSMVAEPTTISGRANSFPSVGIKITGAEIPTDNWPSVVQVVNSEILAKKLGYPLFAFQLELNKELPNGFKREWHTTTIMQPEQHTAYAVQWFALALTLTVLFIVYSFKKTHD
ncbi:MAG: SURF1 family protein [Methylococcaceae bacterium]|nr:SURF1 family protein [Methylococcaceae bacterium]